MAPKDSNYCRPETGHGDLTLTPVDSYCVHMPQPRSVRVNGDVLADIRARQGLTISRLARMIGRHRQSINKLETGRSTHASIVFAWQIANALKVDITEFTITDDTEPEPAKGVAA